MKNAFKKLEALADELHTEEQERNGGCYMIVASPEKDSDKCLTSSAGRPSDLIVALTNFMLCSPTSAAVVKTAVVAYEAIRSFEKSGEMEQKQTSKDSKTLS